MQWKPRPRQKMINGGGLVFSAVMLTTAFLLTQFCGEAVAENSSPAGSSTSTDSESSVKTAISETARNYENAFRKGDAGALALMWAENGTYANSDGNTFNGRAEIERVFQNYFKQADSAKNIEIKIESVKPIGSKGAIEKGVANIKDGDGKLLSTAPYTVIHVNNDGKWEMASVSEEPAQYYDNALEKLRWLNGEWSGKGPEGEATLSTRWMSDQHFMVATFRVKTKSGETHEDMQVIGLDPQSGRIVSWLFDSEGGVGRGVWTTNGKVWAVDLVRTTSEGRKMTVRSLLQPKGSDVFVWKSVGRSLDGLLIPDSDAITVNRIHL